MKKFIPTLMFIFLIVQCTSPEKRARQYIAKGDYPIEMGNITWRGTPVKNQSQEIETIHNSFKKFIMMVVSQNFTSLPEMVNPTGGVWVDLKAHRNMQELKNEIKDSDSYLNRFYFYTDKLQKSTNDKEQISIRDILLASDGIRVDYFMEEGNAQCELKLYLIGSPELEFRLNHPVYIKAKDRWYMFRLP